jgi:hypothetical protein
MPISTNLSLEDILDLEDEFSATLGSSTGVLAAPPDSLPGAWWKEAMVSTRLELIDLKRKAKSAKVKKKNLDRLSRAVSRQPRSVSKKSSTAQTKPKQRSKVTAHR